MADRKDPLFWGSIYKDKQNCECYPTFFTANTDTVTLSGNGTKSDPLSAIASGGSGTLTFDNALTETGTNVQLGGDLVKNTTITSGGSFNITLSGTVDLDNALLIVNTTSHAIEATASSVAIAGTAPDLPIWGINNDTSTNFQSNRALLLTRTGVNATDGIGVHISFQVVNSVGVPGNSGYFKNVLTTATSGAEVGAFQWHLPSSGFVSTVKRMELSGNGNLSITGNLVSAQPSVNGAGAWLLGKLVTAAVTPDATRYVEVSIDGVVLKLIVAS